MHEKKLQKLKVYEKSCMGSSHRLGETWMSFQDKTRTFHKIPKNIWLLVNISEMKKHFFSAGDLQQAIPLKEEEEVEEGASC